MGDKEHKTRSKAELQGSSELTKVVTGIAGLDLVLKGGLPAGRTSLVTGGPGTGKSLLGLEFIYKSAMKGEPGIFLTFEERAEAVRQNANTLGWDLKELEADGKLFIMYAHIDSQAIISGDFKLLALLAIIEGKAKAMGAKRIVVDALDVLLRLFDDPKRERNELFALHDWFKEREMTTVLTVKKTQDGRNLGQYEFLDFMADCVIALDNRVLDQVSTRRMRVIKYRGSAFGRNEYPFVIGTGGMHIIPITNTTLQHQALGKHFSSGQSQLDAVLGGGYRRASSILFTGSSGTGKSTLAATFTRAACQRGEKVFYINFEESLEAMVSCMRSPGIDLLPFLKDKTLHVLSTLPESIGAEEHLFQSLDVMERFQPEHLVIDAISACRRMGSEQVAFDYIMRMVNACKERGITAILINQASGFAQEEEISGIGLSSIIDTVIFLRHVEIGGEINRMLLVMKSRGSQHSNQVREFLITNEGIQLADVYAGEGGVLTGVARQEREAREEAERLLRLQEIERKEKEIAKQRTSMEAETARLQAELALAEAELERLRLANNAAIAAKGVRSKMRKGDSQAEQK